MILVSRFSALCVLSVFLLDAVGVAVSEFKHYYDGWTTWVVSGVSILWVVLQIYYVLRAKEVK